MKHTTFENETHLLTIGDEHLVTATVNGATVYVVSNGYQTDYPRPDTSVTVQWDNPEYFSPEFKKAVKNWILTDNALTRLPSGVPYALPAMFNA